MKHQVLPDNLVPRGVCRAAAAAYVGVSTFLFDQMVVDGRMPKPKTINTRRVWDREALDAAFTSLPDLDGPAEDNPWDSAA